MEAAAESPTLPDDWFHRHPHVTTVLAALAAAVFVGVALVAGGIEGSTLALGTFGTAALLAIACELASLRLRFPLVPYLLTGEGLGDYRAIAGEAGGGPHVWGGGDCGGGGGDGGGGGG
jgi:hypothetical protein